jgi:hypothetical protein
VTIVSYPGEHFKVCPMTQRHDDSDLVREAEAPEERVVDRRLPVAREHDEPREGLDPLQQTVDLEVRVAVGRVPGCRCACRRARRPRRRTAPLPRSASLRAEARFFSVSPMYFETTAEGSIRYRSYPARARPPRPPSPSRFRAAR